MAQPQQNDGAGFLGFEGPSTASANVSALTFLVRMLLGQIGTATIVQVEAVTNAGEVAPQGFVDVHPLVNQIDGNWNAVPHGTVFRLPYSRLQTGTDAIIMDPKVGDIGIAVFADHDISAVKATLGQANPGSRRRFDMADGMYLFSVLSGVTPGQYIRFYAGGIDVVTPGNMNVTVGGALSALVTGTASVESGDVMTLTAPHIIMDTPLVSITGVVDVENSRHIGGNTARFNGPVEILTGDLTLDAGNAVVSGDVTAGTISLENHVHSGVQPGGGDTGKPVP